MLLQVLLAPVVLFTVYRLVQWTRHYLAARKYNVPIILIPVAFNDLGWLPLRPLFSWVEKLPFGLGSWYLYTGMGRPVIDGHATTARLGETFLLCSPAGNQIVSSYPPTLQQVYRDVFHWHMPASQGAMFAIYGENVLSTEGAEWQRHRKVTAAAFNELP